MMKIIKPMLDITLRIQVPEGATIDTICEELVRKLKGEYEIAAESEDERIRKNIVSIIKQYSRICAKEGDSCDDINECLAWLEKQKEASDFAGLMNKLSAREQQIMFDAWDYEVKKKLEKQKEQKPTAESVLIKAGLEPYKDGNQWCILAGDNLQEGICGFGDTIEDALYDFLMAVINMQKEQKPAEWSEEDERIFNQLILRMDGHHYTYEVLQSMKRWLKERMKILRPWKPSEEQISAISTTLKYVPNNAEEWLLLDNLINDLKKL